MQYLAKEMPFGFKKQLLKTQWLDNYCSDQYVNMIIPSMLFSSLMYGMAIKQAPIVRELFRDHKKSFSPDLDLTDVLEKTLLSGLILTLSVQDLGWQ